MTTPLRPRGRDGYVSPTPTEFMGQFVVTPTASRMGSLSPSKEQQSAHRRSTSVSGQEEEDDAELRQLEEDGPPPSLLSTEEELASARATELAQAARAAAAASGLMDESHSSAADQLNEEEDSSAAINHEMIDARMDDESTDVVAPVVAALASPVLLKLQRDAAASATDATPPMESVAEEEKENAAHPHEPESSTADALSQPRELEPHKLVMHLFSPAKAAAAAEEEGMDVHRSRLKFVDNGAPAAAVPAPLDVSTLQSCDDAGTLRSAVQRLASERQALVHSLRIEKSVTALLETQAATQAQETQAAKRHLAQELARQAQRRDEQDKLEGEVHMHQSSSAPLLLGTDGLPLVLAAEGFAAPPSSSPSPAPAEADIVSTADAVMQTDDAHMLTPRKAAPSTADACAGTSPPPVVAPDAAPLFSRAQVRSHVQEPLTRAATECKAAANDIGGMLESYGAALAVDSVRIVESVRAAAAQAAAAAAAASSAEPATDASEWQARFHAEKKARMRLHDKLLEMQGNIRVIARVRPQAEACSAAAATAAANDAASLEPEALAAVLTDEHPRILDDHSLQLQGKLFEFDRVFGPAATQAEVYAAVAPFIQSVCDGQAATVLAYGQTGSGKTFTMDGGADVDQVGINSRALEQLFSALAAQAAARGANGSGLFASKVRLSAVEVYNEAVKDLLVEPTQYKRSMTMPQQGNSSTNNEGATPRGLDIVHAPDGSIAVPGLTSREVQSPAEIHALIHAYVRANRSTACTSMNEYSSRSHLVLFVHVDSQCTLPNGEIERTQGRLVLVDLAGSERVSRSGVQGSALKEAAHINKSLAALGDVMAALRTKAPHVPHRNSRLTYLLSDCLLPRSKVLMFACTSSSPLDVSESVCTLQFAARARNVQLGPAQAKKTRSQTASLLAKLAASEAALSESHAAAGRLEAELRSAREEQEVERARAAKAVAEAAARSLKLEQDFELKKKMFSIPLIPAPGHASAGSISAPLAPTLASIAVAVSTPSHPHAATVAPSSSSSLEAEVARLQQLLRAKEREVLELKMQRNNPAMAVGAGASVANSATQQQQQASVMSPTPRALPQIHPASASKLLRGVNLLESPLATAAAVAAVTSSAAATIAAPIPFTLPDVASTDTAAAADVAMEELPLSANPVAKQRDSLTGKKRKESPLKSAAEDAAEEVEADENAGPASTGPAAPVAPVAQAPAAVVAPKLTLGKKPRLAAVAPSTPGRAALGQTTSVLNKPGAASSSASSKSSAATKTISSLFHSTLAVIKTPVGGVGGKKTRLAAATKVSSAAAERVAAANAALLDSSVVLEEDEANRTPVSSNANASGKSVRFGGASTKFISPEPIAPISVAAAAIAAAMPPIAAPLALGHSASSSALVGSKAQRTAQAGAKGAGPTSLGLGAARRQQVKAGWKTY